MEEEKHELCVICQDGEEKTEKLACNHSYHYECLWNHLKYKIEDKNLDIKCAVPGCDFDIPQQTIFHTCPDLIEKYNEFSF